jgi:[protein-PII] uridylyltransferase
VVLKSAEARVHIDRDSSTTSTVVEVHCRDQVGVLSRITGAIAELELDIRSAKVHTLGDEVVDSFYLCDQDGNKVEDDDYLAELERGILHAVTLDS